MTASVRRLRRQTQKTYEKYPYPAANRTALTHKRWNLAPMEWIMALWRPGREDDFPQRILVAGCGSGSEAFALARKFPDARIIAVDFSRRSLSIARSLQRRSTRMRNIRFVHGDLSDPGLAKITGGEFDFISCHGVLSYIPEPERVLRHLARQLRSDGALFLGVNGSDHFSGRGRPFLASFGFDLADLREPARLQSLLDLWDLLLRSQGETLLPNRRTGYLAGDLFGPLIQNWPLSRWVNLARQADLHLKDNYSSWRKRRTLMEGDHARRMWPRSRADISLLLDVLMPETFHRALFTKQKTWNPPWSDRAALLGARPAISGLYRRSVGRKQRRGLVHATLRSRPLNTRLDWEMPEWEAEIIRRADGRQTVREILRKTPAAKPGKLLAEQLYRMHQLLVLSLLP